MDRQQAKDTAKGMIEDYLLMKGINPRREFNCLSPDHTDSTPSMSLDRKHNRVKCFGCNRSFDIFDLVALDYGLTDQREIFDKTYEVLGLTVENTPRRSTPEEDFGDMDGQKQDKTGQPTHTHTDVYTHTATHTHTDKAEEDRLPYYEACSKRITETDYPERRGLSRETLARHMIGYEPSFKTKNPETDQFETWQALIIPTGRGSYTIRNTDPAATKKNRYRNRGDAQLFNYKTLYSSASPVFVVEGEIDAMSIEEAGGSAVALGNFNNGYLLTDQLKRKRPAEPQPLILAFDNEEEEAKQERVNKAEEELQEALRGMGLSCYRFRPYGGSHDANEALLRNKAAFTEALRRAERIGEEAEEEKRERYLSSSAGAHIQDFINGITERANTDAIPTGFKTLDAILDGGLYEGLITVGGISSLGKTSLIMQVADQVASAGTDVLIFSLEMSRAQLMAKSISRHTIQLARERGIDTRNAKTSRGITSGKRYANYNRTELQLIQDAITAYSKYAERIYIQEGVGDIGVAQLRETVEKHIYYTGGKWLTDDTTGERILVGGHRPLVICDYLQIIAPHSDRATDKQVIDHAVLELKRISRDYKLPVIAISAFNRAGYKLEATFEQLKESGAIEYSSDIVLGLQLGGVGVKNFDPTQAKKKNPREIELVVLKNRDAAVGDKVAFNYYPMFNLFDDTGLSN